MSEQKNNNVEFVTGITKNDFVQLVRIANIDKIEDQAMKLNKVIVVNNRDKGFA